MRCIFCKADSSNSRTVEHIVPESLGNTAHTLPVGVVCDKCNAYFAIKIEKPILDAPYFRHSRFRNSVANKRGRIPSIEGVHLQTEIVLEVCKSDEGLSIYTTREKDNNKFANGILMQNTGSLILPVGPKRESNIRLMSRFIGKIAIEALAQRMIVVEGGQEEIITEKAIDSLRDYVRWNKGKFDWQFSTRQIYSEGNIFHDVKAEYEILHEYTFSV